MTKLGDTFRSSQRLVIAAKEEADRLGQPVIDVDHLLLGLLVTPGAGGELLREAGVRLPAAREAVVAVHAERVASLGITVPAVEPPPLRDVALTEMEFTPRALSFMPEDDRWSDAAVLRGLLSEPSGLPRDVLTRLGVDVEALTVAAARWRPAPEDEQAPTPPGSAWRAISSRGFVPAPPEQVWQLVHDPARRPDWDPFVAAAEPAGPGDWILTNTSPRPDARSPRPGFEQTRLRLVALEPETVVEWECTWPGRGARTATQRLRLALQPTTGGTTLTATLALRRRSGWRRLAQTALAPVSRLFLHHSLIQLTSAVSRSLR